MVEQTEKGDFKEGFEELHKREFGFAMP